MKEKLIIRLNRNNEVTWRDALIFVFAIFLSLSVYKIENRLQAFAVFYLLTLIVIMAFLSVGLEVIKGK